MNLSIYKNLKVLVTGSTGFKGSWLCYWLNEIGAKVVGVSLRPEKNSILYKSLNFNYYIEDSLSKSSIGGHTQKRFLSP